MRRYVTLDITSLTTGFVMVVMVVAILNTEPFVTDGVSGYDDHSTLYRTELFFSGETPSQSLVLFASNDVSDDDAAEDRILTTPYLSPFFDTALARIHNPGKINTRPFFLRITIRDHLIFRIKTLMRMKHWFISRCSLSSSHHSIPSPGSLSLHQLLFF
jgi:hypothetical protein